MFLVVFGLVVAVVWVVSAPLRREGTDPATQRDNAELAALVAAKEAKYREIRELELDHRTGKLSEADFRKQDRALRGEAVALLESIERLGGEDADSDA